MICSVYIVHECVVTNHMAGNVAWVMGGGNGENPLVFSLKLVDFRVLSPEAVVAFHTQNVTIFSNPLGRRIQWAHMGYGTVTGNPK